MLYYKKVFNTFLASKVDFISLYEKVSSFYTMDIHLYSKEDYLDNPLYSPNMSLYEKLLILSHNLKILLFIGRIYDYHKSVLDKLQNLIDMFTHTYIGSYKDYMALKSLEILVRTESDPINKEILQIKINGFLIPGVSILGGLGEEKKYYLPESIMMDILDINDIYKFSKKNSIAYIHDNIIISIKQNGFSINLQMPSERINFLEPLFFKQLMDIHKEVSKNDFYYNGMHCIVSMNTTYMKTLDTV